ncbi:MAG: FkbM family methyltransferase [Hyphomicrobiales bacterium]|nr:FkbM family methyltransferase [Hyphomicrobiales bacterium]
MDLSYAQHLEDHHLSLAFAGQREGFYIDVGGGHPVADNVSCWFYLQGWRGLVVEPQTDLAALYAHVRPRDLVFAGLVGAESGETDFHVVDRLHGFSTMKADVAGLSGAGFATRRLPIATLAQLAREHALPRVDFLKIDVEGAEIDVLRGIDWSRLRPRVILLEAVAPGSMAPSHEEWEPLLLAQDYVFVLFEGLNRFYVAREETELLARFPRAQSDWLVTPHLGHTNRAPFRDDHPDHAFAKELTGCFFAALPMMDRGALVAMLTARLPEEELARKPDAAMKQGVIDRLFPASPDARTGLADIEAPTLREYYARVVDSDAFRVTTGRLAMSWDGGQILDD